MARKRPPTVDEIKARRAPRKKETIRILNVSKQLVPIHLKPPRKQDGDRTDFYVGAQDVRLGPGQDHLFDADRIWSSQITRLQKQGRIRIVGRSKQE